MVTVMLQLDPGLNLDSLGLSRAGRIVAEALQRYGAYVGDYSGAISIYAENSAAAQAHWKGVLQTYEFANKVDLSRLRVLKFGALTDESGHAELTRLGRGPFSVKASAAGYDDYFSPLIIREEAQTAADLPDGFVALHQRGVEPDVQPGKPPLQNVKNVLNYRACR